MKPLSALAHSLLIICALFAPSLLRAETLTPAARVEKALGGSISQAKLAALEKAIAACIQDDRKECDKFASTILKSGRADAKAIAPELTKASLHALGKEINQAEVSGIISESVKATPDAVLEIIRACAHEVPKNFVPFLVSAAIQAVSDPYKMVRKPIQEDGPSMSEASEGSLETLAEAIVDAALLGSGMTDRAALVAAADSALGNSLSGLMGSVHSPEAKGNFGDPNYGNTPQVKAPTTPVASK